MTVKIAHLSPANEVLLSNQASIVILLKWNDDGKQKDMDSMKQHNLKLISYLSISLVQQLNSIKHSSSHLTLRRCSANYQ